MRNGWSVLFVAILKFVVILPSGDVVVIAASTYWIRMSNRVASGLGHATWVVRHISKFVQ